MAAQPFLSMKEDVKGKNSYTRPFIVACSAPHFKSRERKSTAVNIPLIQLLLYTPPTEPTSGDSFGYYTKCSINGFSFLFQIAGIMAILYNV